MFEGRFDTEQPLQGHLARLYVLRREADAMKRMVIPSKENLLRDAQPLDRMVHNTNVRTLVVDRAVHGLFAAAMRDGRMSVGSSSRRADLGGLVIEFTEHETGLVIALDAQGQFCGAYKFSGDAQPTPTASPAGQGR